MVRERDSSAPFQLRMNDVLFCGNTGNTCGDCMHVRVGALTCTRMRVSSTRTRILVLVLAYSYSHFKIFVLVQSRTRTRILAF